MNAIVKNGLLSKMACALGMFPDLCDVIGLLTRMTFSRCVLLRGECYVYSSVHNGLERLCRCACCL
jgi:hypothetical protein